jgi:hypothetical protein
MSKKSLLTGFLGAIFLFLSGNTYAQSDDKEMVKSVLESFCQDYYSSCFSNRTYVENSLTVNRVEQASLNQVKAYGFHSYKGMFGSRYSQMEYYAYIKVNSTSITIKFYKKSQKDFFHDEDYWEDCSKTIYADD